MNRDGRHSPIAVLLATSVTCWLPLVEELPGCGRFGSIKVPEQGGHYHLHLREDDLSHQRNSIAFSYNQEYITLLLFHLNLQRVCLQQIPHL